MRMRTSLLALALMGGGCQRNQDRPTKQELFTYGFAAELRRGLPGSRVTIKQPLLLDVAFRDGGSSTVSLENPFRECQGEMEGCDAAERQLRSMAQTSAAEENGGDPATLRPVLHDARFLAGVEDAFKDAPPKQRAGNRLVTTPFVADIMILYAFDMPDGMRMVSESDRQELGLKPAALDALARKNLDAALPGPLPDEEIAPRIHEVHAGDSYEASRILLDDRWKAPARAVKGDLLAAAPVRDFVLYTGSREGDAVLSRFRALIHEYEATRGHPISVTILQRTASGWRAFAP
jgi:hypothetical protein